MLSFFPRGVLDEILNLIESVSEDFPSYSCKFNSFLEVHVPNKEPVLRHHNLLTYFFKKAIYK